MKIISCILGWQFTLLLFVSVALSCKEKEPPFPDQITESTTLSDLTDATLTAHTDFLSTLPGEVSQYGHVWVEGDGMPLVSGQGTKLFKDTAPVPFEFTSHISGLKRNTMYTIRAYVITSAGVAYGAAEVFRTKSDYIDRLVRILDDSLKGRDFGYSFVVMQRGVRVGAGQGGLQARAIEASGAISVSTDSRMQIASMTKTLTAAAFLRLAAEKGIATTDKIVDYLPGNWEKGENFDKITFRDLLRHRSGITGSGDFCRNGAFSENNWTGLKSIAAKGIGQQYGNYCYQNANFGLFRILIPAMLGYVFTGNDDTDNQETMQLYEGYMRTGLLERAGVMAWPILANATERPTYGYDFPYTEGTYGFNPGSFDAHAGGYGIYLSAHAAGRLYAALMGDGNFNVLTQAQKDTLLTKDFGSFSTVTPNGRFSYHDGWWQINLGNGVYRGFRSLWMSCPDDIVVVMFTNGLRHGDGLFPIRAFQYQDITSYVLWAFSRLHEDSAPARLAPTDFHQYLGDPNPH